MTVISENCVDKITLIGFLRMDLGIAEGRYF
jgi:hypothetical protein